MFGFKKSKNNPEINQPPVDQQTYTDSAIHTMEDDLSYSGGVALSERTTNLSNRNNASFENQAIFNDRKSETKKTPSPFLAQTDNTPSTATSPSSFDFQPEIKSQQQVFIPPQKNQIDTFGSSKTLLIIAAIMAFLAFSAGGYYFWISREASSKNSSDAINNVAPEELPLEEPIIIEPQPQKFSLDKPNYLIIDSANSNQQNLKSLIMTASENIKELSPQNPIEFIPVDVNNNPITFSDFALISGINLTPATEYLGETFSLYIYPDTDGTKIGLAINLKDKQQALLAMQAKEKTLPQDLSFLFLDTVLPAVSDRSFMAFVGPKYTIRYINLDAVNDGSIAIDYALTDQQLIIASSKNMMFRLMEKIAGD